MAAEAGLTAPSRRAPPGWRAYAAAAVAFAVLVGLGTWQVQRLHWKENLIATIEERRHSEPQPLAGVERIYAATGEVDYQPVRLSGTFLHDKEQFFFATWKGATGYYVYTPLRLDDGRFVLVNRGFVPYELKDRARRPQGETAGPVTVTGLARNPLAGKPSSIIPDNDPAKNIFYWKDRDAMAANAGLEPGRLVPFFVDADAAPNPGGLPEGGVTQIDLPNNHLQYALTWYGLAAALAAVFASFVFRNRAKA